MSPVHFCLHLPLLLPLGQVLDLKLMVGTSPVFCVLKALCAHMDAHVSDQVAFAGSPAPAMFTSDLALGLVGLLRFGVSIFGKALIAVKSASRSLHL